MMNCILLLSNARLAVIDTLESHRFDVQALLMSDAIYCKPLGLDWQEFGTAPEGSFGI